VLKKTTLILYKDPNYTQVSKTIDLDKYETVSASNELGISDFVIEISEGKTSKKKHFLAFDSRMKMNEWAEHFKIAIKAINGRKALLDNI